MMYEGSNIGYFGGHQKIEVIRVWERSSSYNMSIFWYPYHNEIFVLLTKKDFPHYCRYY